MDAVFSDCLQSPECLYLFDIGVISGWGMLSMPILPCVASTFESIHAARAQATRPRAKELRVKQAVYKKRKSAAFLRSYATCWGMSRLELLGYASLQRDMFSVCTPWLSRAAGNVSS